MEQSFKKKKINVKVTQLRGSMKKKSLGERLLPQVLECSITFFLNERTFIRNWNTRFKWALENIEYTLQTRTYKWKEWRIESRKLTHMYHAHGAGGTKSGLSLLREPYQDRMIKQRLWDTTVRFTPRVKTNNTPSKAPSKDEQHTVKIIRNQFTRLRHFLGKTWSSCCVPATTQNLELLLCASHNCLRGYQSYEGPQLPTGWEWGMRNFYFKTKILKILKLLDHMIREHLDSHFSHSFRPSKKSLSSWNVFFSTEKSKSFSSNIFV